MPLSVHTAFHMRLLPTGHASTASPTEDDGLAPPAGLLPDRQRSAPQALHAAEMMHLERPRRIAAGLALVGLETTDQVIRTFDPTRPCRDIVDKRTCPAGAGQMLQPPQLDTKRR